MRLLAHKVEYYALYVTLCTSLTCASLILTFFPVFNAVFSQGREEGAVIENWEDPDLSIYKSTDRYGFMQ